MENFQNRIGHDNFVWWIGVVEDRDDPLYLGRCKVRIFGSHTENLQLIPTDSLPWAMPLYPVNNSRNYATPMEGDYVFGFFSDGTSCQAPVFMGVFPGIPQEEPRAGVGFSALAKRTTSAAETTQISSNEADAGATALAQQEGSAFASNENDAEAAALAQQEGSAFAVTTQTYTAPRVSARAPDMKLIRVGQPTTPKNAYSANGTIIAVTNSQLTHACDFRFLIDFPGLDIGGIINPVTAIQQAIKDAQNKAAAIIRAFINQIIDKFRLVLKAIIIGLNLDPTGQIAKIISRVREAIRTINYYIKKLAEIIGNIALVIALFQQIRQIIEWIKSLPATVLGMLRQCLSNFQNAIKSAGEQISLIPGQVSGSVEEALGQLKNSTDEAIVQAEDAQQSANIPNSLITLITSPESANVNVLSEYITTQFPNANVIISNVDSASFNVANSSTP